MTFLENEGGDLSMKVTLLSRGYCCLLASLRSTKMRDVVARMAVVHRIASKFRTLQKEKMVAL